MVIQQRLQSQENPKTILFESLSIQLTSNVSVTTTFTMMAHLSSIELGPFQLGGSVISNPGKE